MNNPIGSEWRRWDLHFHTPKSTDHRNKGLTAKNLVERLLYAEIAVVVVADHHILDPGIIREMQDEAGSRMTVLPGMELSSNLGGRDGIHFVAIFSESSNIEFISSELMSKLELSSKREEGLTEEQLYVELPKAAEVIQSLGGIISIHGHKKHSNIEGISNHLSFKMQVKTDLLRESVDLIEVSDPRFAEDYHSKVFPSIGFVRPIICCSDDHGEGDYSSEQTTWIKADPTFAGLHMALREPEERFHICMIPPSIERLNQNKTHFIRSIAFGKCEGMPNGEQWLQGEVLLNPVIRGTPYSSPVPRHRPRTARPQVPPHQLTDPIYKTAHTTRIHGLRPMHLEL